MNDGGILFTAFEPSGDALAAKLAAELKRREPGRAVYALGGPVLRAAGAELLEETTAHAAMGLSVLGHMQAHKQRLRRMRAWLRDHAIAAVIPVDSPAANWSVCEVVRREQPRAKVVHLVCPQVWAWATWRVKKLRRLTDHVLCILPFEPAWLAEHGVPATFVGHPLYGEGVRGQASGVRGKGLMTLALLPGSRAGEIRKNWGTMLAVYGQLQRDIPGLRGRVAAYSDALARMLREAVPQPDTLQLTIEVGATDDILLHSDAALVVSGTATLHTAARDCPMVVLYNANWWAWQLLGRWLIKTRTFSLPNVLAESLGLPGRVPEFVPHFGAVEPVAAATQRVMRDGRERQLQADLFASLSDAFACRNFAVTAADVLEGVVSNS